MGYIRRTKSPRDSKSCIKLAGWVGLRLALVPWTAPLWYRRSLRSRNHSQVKMEIRFFSLEHKKPYRKASIPRHSECPLIQVPPIPNLPLPSAPCLWVLPLSKLSPPFETPHLFTYSSLSKFPPLPSLLLQVAMTTRPPPPPPPPTTTTMLAFFLEVALDETESV